MLRRPRMPYCHLVVYLAESSDAKKALTSRRPKRFRIAVALDGLVFQPHAAQGEKRGLCRKFFARDTIFHHGRLREAVEQDRDCQMMRKPSAQISLYGCLDGVAGFDGGVKASFDFCNEEGRSSFEKHPGKVTIALKTL